MKFAIKIQIKSRSWFFARVFHQAFSETRMLEREISDGVICKAIPCRDYRFYQRLPIFTKKELWRWQSVSLGDCHRSEFGELLVVLSNHRETETHNEMNSGFWEKIEFAMFSGKPSGYTSFRIAIRFLWEGWFLLLSIAVQELEWCPEERRRVFWWCILINTPLQTETVSFFTYFSMKEEMDDCGRQEHLFKAMFKEGMLPGIVKRDSVVSATFRRVHRTPPLTVQHNMLSGLKKLGTRFLRTWQRSKSSYLKSNQTDPWKRINGVVNRKVE